MGVAGIAVRLGGRFGSIGLGMVGQNFGLW